MLCMYLEGRDWSCRVRCWDGFQHDQYKHRRCKYLEKEYIDTPIVWRACRHHVYELQLQRVCQEIFGQTKEPGTAIFRRLKSSWHSLEIDYEHIISNFDYSSVSSWILAIWKILVCAESELAKIPGCLLITRSCWFLQLFALVVSVFQKIKSSIINKINPGGHIYI